MVSKKTVPQKERRCAITMSDDGHNPTGMAHYWICGKPAKFTALRRPHKNGMTVDMCGVHAGAERKLCLKWGWPSPTSINPN